MDFLAAWPEFDAKAMAKLERLDHTALRHVDQKRKIAQSNRTQHESLDLECTFQSHVATKTNDFMHAIVDFDNAICIDQIGKFKYKSKRGFNCIFLACSYNANGILVRPIKSRKASELLDILQEIHHYLARRGFKLKH